MKKTVLSAAAILVATGTAFAGSDHYSDASSQPFASHPVSKIDTAHTGSIRKAKKELQDDGNASVPAQYGRGIWGN
ncbi:DUF680 domain-containing protein [Mesorhizobium sp. M0586]|uniref:DUF680 domain-containing protein n=1 Tax=unclassified Mesorhizobium TaxID=325217 RepID=UPI00333B9477